MRFLRDNAQTIIVINILLSLLLCGVMLYIDWTRKHSDDALPVYLQAVPRPAASSDAAPAPPPASALRAEPTPVGAAQPTQVADGQSARAD